MLLKDYLFILLFICTSVLWLCSCTNDQECIHDTSVSAGTSFAQPIYNEEKKGNVIQPINDTVKIYGLNNDSILNDTLSISSIRLSLKPFENSTAYVVVKDKHNADTITFSHQNRERFISIECGVMITHILEKVIFTTHNIDSVRILDRNIKDNKTNNQVIIYFKEE